MLVVALVVSLPFLYVVWRRPVLRRIAVRNAARRPREALLVIVGSLFGTAIITGSLVVGDTIDASVRSLAYTRLGPIDETIVSPRPGTAADAFAAVRETRSSLIDGVLQFSVLSATAAAGPVGDRRAAPRAQIVEFDFEQAATFGGQPSATGIRGPTPAEGHAVITSDLAHQIGAGKGDQIAAFVYGRQTSFTVDRVVSAKGLAGFSTGFFNQPSRNLLVGPGTIAQLSRGMQPQIDAGRFAPPDYIVAVSNRGGVESGAPLTSEVTRRLDRSLQPLGVTPSPVKQQVLDQADQNAAQFRQLFGAMGAFGVLAGILLLVNIFVMLGEERKPELGMLRAVGLRRSSLVAAFSTEGWLYSLAAAAAGTVVGLALGRAIIAVVQRIFESDIEGFGLPLRFSAQGGSLATGFTAGLVIAVVSVILTSVRISRFNVIRAIRELPEPRRTGLRLRWLVAGAAVFVLGGAMTVASVEGDAPLARQLGPVFMVLGGALLLGRRFDRRIVTTVASATVLVWSAVLFPLSTGLGDAGITVFVVQGVVLTAAAVVLVTEQHDVFERLARRLGAGTWAMAARLGLAYPVARRLRTGLTLAMYSLVIFTLTFITVLSAVFSNQIDDTARRISGGYDVFVQTNPGNPVSADQLQSVDGVQSVAPLSRLPVHFDICSSTDANGTCQVGHGDDWGVSGFTAAWLEHGPPQLEDRGTYETDMAAYRAVLADPNLVLVDRFFLNGGGGPPDVRVEPGDHLQMRDPQTGKMRELTVAAISADDFLINGALYGMPGFKSFFGPRAVPDRFYLGVQGNSSTVASAIAGRFVEQGVQADPIRDLLAQRIAVQNQFFQLFRGYLGFGLLVGIAGLGVVMVRAVRERRREIGVLRSLGFQSRVVRRSFAFESAFVALEGTVIGVVLALVTSFNVMANTDAFGENAAFTVPFVGLLVIVIGTLIASLLATAAPTRSAARIRPAVALRIAD